MRVRATVTMSGAVMSGLAFALAACGSTAQSVKSLGAVPALDTTDRSIPPISIPDISIPDITVPNITVPNVTNPVITLPKVTTPAGTGPAFTVPRAPVTTSVTTPATSPATDAPPVTDAPVGTNAPSGGGTQSITANGITMSIPSDWTSLSGAGSAVTSPAGLGGSTALFTSPAGDSLIVAAVPVDYSLYKSALPTLAGSGGSVKETKVDGRDAALVDASVGGGVSEYLLIDGGSGKSLFIVFTGASNSSKAIADGMFQSIKITG